MKRFLSLCLIIAIFTVSAPLIALPDSDGPLIEIKSETKKEEAAAVSEAASKEEKEVTVKVFSPSDNSVSSVSEKDYIIGSVAAEMPITYDEEALKAQAVACYTFLKWKQNQNNGEGKNGADIENSENDQTFMTKEQMKEKWGDGFEKYYKKLSSAVESVYGKTITYENEPIMAVFHALSAGKTEDAEVVWGKKIPYLKSVSSEGDRLSPAFSSTLVLSTEEFEKLLSTVDGLEFSGKAKDYIGEIKRSPAGTVTEIKICNKVLAGEQLRAALSLKSSAFDIGFKDGSFIITADGYGHFVGMSQYGADYMAKQGFKYDEILKHYYTDIEIK
ncbi:MAG: stage II sporulation protein D [Ruminococcaceae bacterium]|nr:stage II sporulation protein D [Oscillospiraceae bacterium]